jgi:hypothetical protein
VSIERLLVLFGGRCFDPLKGKLAGGGTCGDHLWSIELDVGFDIAKEGCIASTKRRCQLGDAGVFA